MTLTLLSIGFAFPVQAQGLVIDVNFDEHEGVIQIDGTSIPSLIFPTPAGPATMLFAPRLAGGTFDHETGEIAIENFFVGLEFLGTVLPVSFALSTGAQSVEGFEVMGVPFDEESGEVVLVGAGLVPAGPLSPPIAVALTIEGILRGE